MRARNYSVSRSTSICVHPNLCLHNLSYTRGIKDGARFYSSTLVLQKFSLDDGDVEEAFVKGSGPGGQKINKVRNCVQLKHLPTGIMVSCQDGRSLAANRAIARKQLEKKVELAMHGADSRLGKAIKKKQKQKQKSTQRARLKYHNDPIDIGSPELIIEELSEQTTKQEQTVGLSRSPLQDKVQNPSRTNGVKSTESGLIDYDSDDEDDGDEDGDIVIESEERESVRPPKNSGVRIHDP